MKNIPKSKSEKVFFGILCFGGISIILLLLSIFFTLWYNSLLSLKTFGIKFFTSSTWDPVVGEFGALPFLVGTILTSFLALFISLPFSLAISIFLGEYFREGYLSSFLKSINELLAAIPSVIYGFWGLFILAPVIQLLQIQIGVPAYGVGIFTASLILSIMIIPYSAAIGREVIELVPQELKEAAYSLGATRYEVIKKIVIPYVRSGIFAGIFLALGRALGETMAVTMVIGNANILPTSIFSPANTMASVIANEFAEAVEDIYLASLIEIGFLLFLVTAVINIIGKFIIKRLSVEKPLQG